ncbi:hypothetical protein RRG08_001178 [Elysia crispata]|uniref:Uncharacterized protein n=1 Tax=Elysia crispata TaxID=231223 RepID=A0AAE1DX62_9GAST|nr:hypothetical protein RRG08_001178 [Elysia crispata]
MISAPVLLQFIEEKCVRGSVGVPGQCSSGPQEEKRFVTGVVLGFLDSVLVDLMSVEIPGQCTSGPHEMRRFVTGVVLRFLDSVLVDLMRLKQGCRAIAFQIKSAVVRANQSTLTKERYHVQGRDKRSELMALSNAMCEPGVLRVCQVGANGLLQLLISQRRLGQILEKTDESCISSFHACLKSLTEFLVFVMETCG